MTDRQETGAWNGSYGPRLSWTEYYELHRKLDEARTKVCELAVKLNEERAKGPGSVPALS